MGIILADWTVVYTVSEHFSSQHLMMDVYTELGAKMTRLKNSITEVGVTKACGIDDPVPVNGQEVKELPLETGTTLERWELKKGIE